MGPVPLLLAVLAFSPQDDPADPFVARSLAAGRELLDGAEGERRRELVKVLAQYSSDRNPKVSRPALDALAAFIRSGAAQDRPEDLDGAMQALAESAHPDREAAFRTVVDSKLQQWARVAALRHLAGCRGPASVPELKQRLGDPLLKSASARLLGGLMRGSGDEALLALLKDEGDRVQDPEDLGAIALAIRDVGGDRTRPVLKVWIPRLEGWYRAEAAWHGLGIAPLRSIGRLAELGIIAPVPEDRLARLCFQTPLVSSCMTDAMKDSGTWVVVNACAFEPLRYDRMIEGFRDRRKGLFSPTDAEQRRDGDGKLVVEFAHAGKIYSFSPRDLGQWYDLPPLIEAIHRALIDADVKERFVGVRGAMQLSCFVLADPEATARAARELHLPLELDPDAGRKSWLKAREEAARKPR